LQGEPHFPQLALSVLVSVQYGAPPSGMHIVLPVEHAELQPPPMHASALLQAFPHAPQFLLSVLELTHVGCPASPPQRISLAGHWVPHLLPVHVSVAAHALPQVPQFSGSDVMSTQSAPHRLFPGPASSQLGTVAEVAQLATAQPTSERNASAAGRRRCVLVIDRFPTVRTACRR
jgi:hypothetical protein